MKKLKLSESTMSNHTTEEIEMFSSMMVAYGTKATDDVDKLVGVICKEFGLEQTENDFPHIVLSGKEGIIKLLITNEYDDY